MLGRRWLIGTWNVRRGRTHPEARGKLPSRLEFLEARLLKSAGVDWVVLDSSLPDARHLADTADSTRVLLLDSQRDPSAWITRITEAVLASARPVRSLSLLTHGQSGQLWLGSGVVDTQWLDQNADALRRFGRALEGAALDLYGCNVGQGTVGKEFIDALAGETDLAVRASDDLTGRGGDWVLEVASGRADLGPAALTNWLAAFQQHFSGALVAPVARAGTAVPLYVPGGAAVAVNPGLIVTDADSANLASATVTIETGFQANKDVLAVDTSGTNITASYDGATGVLSLTGADSVANYQSVLRQVAYSSSAGSPAGESRILRFSVADDMAETDTAAAAVAISGANRRLEGFEEVDFEDYDLSELVWYSGASQGQYDWDIVNQHVGGPDCWVVDEGGDRRGQIQPGGGAEGCIKPTPAMTDLLVVEWYWRPVEALVNHAFLLIADDQPADPNSWEDGAARIIMNNDGNFWVRDNGGWHNLGLAYDQAGHQCRVEFTWAGEDSTWDFYVDGVLVADDYPNYAALGAATSIDRILFRSSDLGHQQFDDIRMSTYAVLNHDPTLTLPGGGASYTEDGSGQVIDGGATVGDDEANWNGGRLGARITSGAEATDRLRINQAGGVTLSGNTVYVGGTAVGAVNVTEATGGNLLRVTFNANADNAAVQAVVRAIAFRSTSQDPSTVQRTVTFTLTDDMAASASASQTVDVTATNDAPTVTDVSCQVAQDALPGTVVVSVAASDADGPGNLSLNLTGGNDEGIFAIDSAGNITVADAQALYFTTTREFHLTVQAEDGADLSDTAVVTITVLSVPEPDPVEDGGGDGSGDDESQDGGGDGGTPPPPPPPAPTPLPDPMDDYSDDEPAPEPPAPPAPEPDDTTDEGSTDDGSDDGSSPDGAGDQAVEDPVDDPVEDPLDGGGGSEPDGAAGPDGDADGDADESAPSGDGQGGEGDQGQTDGAGQDGQERSVERDAPGEPGSPRRGDPLAIDGPDNTAAASDDSSTYRPDGPDGVSRVSHSPGTPRPRGGGGVSNIDISGTPYDQADPLVRQELVARQSMLERAHAAGLSPQAAQRLAETFGQITRETAERSRSEANVETVTAAAAGTVTLAASTGYFIWTLQSGGLLASALSAMPAWRWMDPMTILDTRGGTSGRRWGRGGSKADPGDEGEQRIARLFDADSRGGKGRA